MKLGPRRQQVYDLLQAGRTAREISREMDLSDGRVYQHIDALRKLGLWPQRQAEA